MDDHHCDNNINLKKTQKNVSIASSSSSYIAEKFSFFFHYIKLICLVGYYHLLLVTCHMVD